MRRLTSVKDRKPVWLLLPPPGKACHRRDRQLLGESPAPLLVSPCWPCPGEPLAKQGVTPQGPAQRVGLS